jgi:hypothetical protein
VELNDEKSSGETQNVESGQHNVGGKEKKKQHTKELMATILC